MSLKLYFKICHQISCILDYLMYPENTKKYRVDVMRAVQSNLAKVANISLKII